MLATLHVARRIDRAEIEFCAAGGGAGVRRFEAGGGVALFSRPGSPLNKVLGLGLSGEVTDADLDGIEAFYREHQSPAQVELCPLGWADVAPRLCARGFVLQSFENQLGALLPMADVPETPGVRVTEITADEEETWVSLAAAGFVAAEPHVGGPPTVHGPSLEEMHAVMASFRHPRRTLARIDGEPAGGAGSWAHDGVLGIFGTSTVPAFRRRGVQFALTAEILRTEGPSHEIATATTAPGSTSQRTFERLGFRVLYTRAILVKP